MKNKKPFYCYLDDFDELTIIIPVKNYKDDNKYYLVGNNEIIKLNISQKTNLGVEIKLVCYFDAYIDLKQVYFVENQNEQMSELHTGKIVRTELFDNIYQYKKEDLGCNYRKESTNFKIWSPVAKYAKIELVSKEGVKEVRDLVYKNIGIWQIVVDGDLEGYKYRYIVYVNGLETVVMDPYAIASSANGEYAFVVDKEKFYQMKHQSDFSGNPLDAIIYEMSVRDFTSDKDMPFENKSKFLGVIEEGIKTPKGNPAGLDYLKSLGITHVQLMPVFDFDQLDETGDNKEYNWGYDPWQYFIPEGSYATDPNDPYARINEFKMMVDKLHENGISVIMDVVYNHVSDADEFPYEKLVPGYPYHFDKQGIRTNISGCNNDIASHRKMMRKLIIDSVLHWVKEYRIDGFRFDLMGLIDYETMNELRQELHDISEHIICYGEGWNMYSSNLTDRMAHMNNKKVLPTIGFFNDKFREIIKGSTFKTKEKGYASGNIKDINEVKQLILGSAFDSHMFKYTNQSINYVECHDNMTFFDKYKTFEDDVELIKKQEKLATSMVILSEGVPFIHSGQEFYRTKQGVENSYISSDDINLIDWKLTDENKADIEYFKKLIELRKQHVCFKLKSTSEMEQNLELLVLNSKSIMIHYSNGCSLLLVFKPTDIEETVIIPEEYKIILASSDKFEAKPDSEYELKDIGTYIFKRDVN